MMKKFIILLFVLAASLSVKAQVYVGGHSDCGTTTTPTRHRLHWPRKWDMS